MVQSSSANESMKSSSVPQAGDIGFRRFFVNDTLGTISDSSFESGKDAMEGIFGDLGDLESKWEIEDGKELL